ncbi:MAG TPA: CRISPR-associated endonuclease Cas1 [Thermoanaerobaculia bacterium]|nr:CRISPR-associated endonuclease Cas1 [Thermoanaerobaculia bacterium]
MATLYLTEQGSMIRKTSDRLVVMKKREVLAEIPCAKLETIFLYGSVQVTTQALAELLDNGIELAFFTMSGRLRGQITPPKAKNVILRMKQYELVSDQQRCLALAKELVAAKIHNSAGLLRRLRIHHPESVPLEPIQELELQAERVSTVASLEELRGVEGSAAARHFSALTGVLPREIGFTGRNRRPPRDPMNALLSFGYVLVGNELQSLLDGMGFDPYIGFFHQLDYGRPSLALDLLEELRAPLVDRFSLGLLSRRQLTPADFEQTPEKGCRLHREPLRRYFAAYEAELGRTIRVADEDLTFRQVFRRQAEGLARSLTTGDPYRSFRWPT